MPANEPYVPGCIYGTGESQDWYNGVPQPSNFQGMASWWTVPTVWYCKWVNGQIFVSPTWDFSAWVFAAKIDQDGFMKFQFPYGANRNGVPTIPMDQFVVTFPPVTYPTPPIFPQVLFFTGSTPQVFPSNQNAPALAYNAAASLYGWDEINLLWMPIIALNNNNVTPAPTSPIDTAMSGQIIFFPGQIMFPGQLQSPALGYDVNNQLYGWLSSINEWMPIIAADSLNRSAVLPYNAIAGQLAYGIGGNASLPQNLNAPQLYYSAAATIYGWDFNAKNQIAIISQ